MTTFVLDVPGPQEVHALACATCPTLWTLTRQYLEDFDAKVTIIPPDPPAGTFPFFTWPAQEAGNAVEVRIPAGQIFYHLNGSDEDVDCNLLDTYFSANPCAASVVVHVQAYRTGMGLTETNTVDLTILRPVLPLSLVLTSPTTIPIFAPLEPIITIPSGDVVMPISGPLVVQVGVKGNPTKLGTATITGPCPGSPLNVSVVGGQSGQFVVACGSTNTCQLYQRTLRVARTGTGCNETQNAQLGYQVIIGGPCFIAPEDVCEILNVTNAHEQLEQRIADGIELITDSASGGCGNLSTSQITVEPTVNELCLRGARGEVSYEVTYKVSYTGFEFPPPVYTTQHLRFFSPAHPMWHEYFPAMFPCECAEPEPLVTEG